LISTSTTPARAGSFGAALAGVVLFLAGTAAAQAPADATSAASELAVGTRVKLVGRLRDDRVFESWSLSPAEPRGTDVLSGLVRAVNPGEKTIVVLGLTVLPYESRPLEVRSAKGRDIELASLRVGQFVRVSGKPRSGSRFRARRIEVVSSAQRRDVEEIEGEIESIGPADASPRRLTVDGIAVEWRQRPPDDDVVYPDGPRVVRRHGELGYRAGVSSLPRSAPLRLGPFRFGARARLDTRIEANFDLDRSKHGDTGRTRALLDLEGTAQISDHLLAFGDFRTERRDVLFDEDRDLEGEERTRMRELFVFAKEPWDLPVDVQIGRQDFEDDRRWLYKDQLDAVRVFAKLGKLVLEGAVGEVLIDADAPDRGIRDWIANASWHFTPKTRAGVFLVDRRDTESNAETLDFGVRTREEPTRGLSHWLDAAMSRGRVGEDGERNFGYGIDTGVTVVFRPDWEPSVTFAYAVGTGDDRPFDGVDRGFRQTGLQDNTGRWNGVATFRYYGEIVDPQLTNLEIFTAGAGVHPIPKTSIDLVGHLYRQESTVAERFRDHSRIRRNTNGESADLGYEIDVILGTRAISNLRLELDLGWFHPGSAFSDRRDDAFVAFLQTEVRF
jgi:alginate production protein